MKKEEKEKESYDYLSDTVSTQECTGLIPANPDGKEAWESYDEIYHFQPKPIIPDSSNRD